MSFDPSAVENKIKEINAQLTKLWDLPTWIETKLKEEVMKYAHTGCTLLATTQTDINTFLNTMKLEIKPGCTGPEAYFLLNTNAKWDPLFPAALRDKVSLGRGGGLLL